MPGVCSPPMQCQKAVFSSAADKRMMRFVIASRSTDSATVCQTRALARGLRCTCLPKEGFEPNQGTQSCRPASRTETTNSPRAATTSRPTRKPAAPATNRPASQPAAAMAEATAKGAAEAAAKAAAEAAGRPDRSAACRRPWTDAAAERQVHTEVGNGGIFCSTAWGFCAAIRPLVSVRGASAFIRAWPALKIPHPVRSHARDGVCRVVVLSADVVSIAATPARFRRWGRAS